MTRVVVTGMGILSANAHGLENFKQALWDGVSGIRFYEELKELGFSCQVGGMPQGVDELKKEYFSSEALLAMNSSMLYAGIAAIDCWKDAGFEVDPEGKNSAEGKQLIEPDRIVRPENLAQLSSQPASSSSGFADPNVTGKFPSNSVAV